MTAKLPYLSKIEAEQSIRPIPKVLRLDPESEAVSYLSPTIKSEWPSVSSRSKKALPVPEYQFYYGDSTESNFASAKKKKIRVPMDRPLLGAWARGPNDQQ